MISRKKVNQYAPGTFEYVYLHGLWRQHRGKKPSATAPWNTDPKHAFNMAKRFAYLPKNGTYLDGKTPADYKCSECQCIGFKLWREYNTFSPLFCANCAAKIDVDSDISDIDSEGRHTSKDLGVKTDSIGWYVPAIPTEELDGYWGYTSVPELGCVWWRKLPTLSTPTEPLLHKN